MTRTPPGPHQKACLYDPLTLITSKNHHPAPWVSLPHLETVGCPPTTSARALIPCLDGSVRQDCLRLFGAAAACTGTHLCLF